MAKPTRSLKAQNLFAVGTIHFVLVILSIIFLIPLLWMISTSLKTADKAVQIPPEWIPNPLEKGNYWEALTSAPFFVYARNTLIVCLLTVTGTVFSNAVVAYSFARLKWPGRETAFKITIATMMVPFPVLMVPLFEMFANFGWVGTFRPLWIPAWFAGAFNIFLMRQFFRGIPFELSEAAKIDGCSEWGIFVRVILPLAKPVLAVVALFSFMATWNDFLGPLLYLGSQDMFTLAIGLRDYHGQAGGTKWNLMMAASTAVVAPVIVLFFFTQRLFIQGIAATGLKG
ncbi:MAG: carbohydrate ABC transporter permease [Armatimonadetes bacterium]|nr:carbohydrate ABC transporter permease [Armatimonadota bacterium]